MPAPVPVILSAVRTPIGRFLGSLSTMTAVELGTLAAREAIKRSGLNPHHLDEAIVGNVLSAGLGQAPARQVALAAGLTPASSALTVNMVCGSGLRAVMLAESAVLSGQSSAVLAGGMESMSNAPHLLMGGRAGWKFGDRPLIDSLLFDGLSCAFEKWPMGQAAEWTARHCSLGRQDVDRFAVESHRRACAAAASGAFQNEIGPVTLPSKKGKAEQVSQDENPRADASLESLARIAPAFDSEGVVTAGNASALSDGAAMLVVASEDHAQRHDAKPIARIVASAVSGVPPRELFLAPVSAIAKVIEKAELPRQKIALYEINEAFASQMLACLHRLEIDPALVNVNGGAIALGHPIGASGARVLVTLIHALRARRESFGVAALCLGGGNAVAILVEAIL